MKIIRAAQCRRMPWKNGGGETTEIATEPHGAGLDSFTWRLSAARVAQDGPFSLFPGVNRTLAALSGEGLDLHHAGRVIRLMAGDAPFSFPGDEPTEGRLCGGAIEDLNIMTRRGFARHWMRRVPVRAFQQLPVDASTLLLFCAEGQVTIGPEVLMARDTAMLTNREISPVEADGQGVLYVIGIEAEGSRASTA